MVLSPYDAEDITQEVMFKIVTNLQSFKHNSSFGTWVYRITVNHCLTMKKKWLEERYLTFSDYEKELDSIPCTSLTAEEQMELITEARLGCLAGMILCLSREQRAIYILGELFCVPHDIGAEILAISKENYRQRLHRARCDLVSFMNKKCGIINKDNPCRCHKKLKGFIKEGWVDPVSLKFNTDFIHLISETITLRHDKLKEIEDNNYHDLQREHPFQVKEHTIRFFSKLLEDSDTIFDGGSI